jgi:hypothetical protein
MVRFGEAGMAVTFRFGAARFGKAVKVRFGEVGRG